MTVYMIAQLTISDRAGYKPYNDGFLGIFKKFGGRLLSVEEAPEVIEGEWPYTRTVLLSFPSKDEAEAWYRSDEYQALAKHRWASSTANLAMLKAL